MSSLFVLLIATAALIPKGLMASIAETSVNRLHEPEADCVFSVHDKGPNGEEVSGTSLNQELYYRIRCTPQPGYCLRVSNCSVSTDAADQKPYPIIDEYGCTKEPSLFEHVEYENDFTAGIYNPYPIRFRGNQQAAVRFQCSTTIAPALANGACPRETCATAAGSEFSRQANERKPRDNIRH